MKRQSLVFLGLFGVSLAAAAADSNTTAGKEAAARYASDKEICAEESSSGARMQCLRDAKAEYTKALDAAKKAPAADSKAKSGASSCTECGRVLEVMVSDKKGEGGALGLIGGGLAGALIGHQVGGGTGKDLATIAGAAGGAYAGHKIEENMKTSKVWSVRVRLDNAKEERIFTFDSDPGFVAGDAVKLSGESIVRR